MLINAALLTFCRIAKKEKFFSLRLIFLWSTPMKDILPEIELLSRILPPRYILQVLFIFEIHCCHGNYWLQRTHAWITVFKTLVNISNVRDTDFDEKKKCHDNKQQDKEQKKELFLFQVSWRLLWHLVLICLSPRSHHYPSVWHLPWFVHTFWKFTPCTIPFSSCYIWSFAWELTKNKFKNYFLS